MTTYVTRIFFLTHRISIRYASDTGARLGPRGVSDYFIHFDQRIWSPICPDTSRYFSISLGYALICLRYVSIRLQYVSIRLRYTLIRLGYNLISSFFILFTFKKNYYESFFFIITDKVTNSSQIFQFFYHNNIDYFLYII
jgi:hypothetical protein